MIPKKIHYCWFGGNPLPELAQKCIDSWKKYCPDYEIKEWNESNFDINCCDYVKEAYQAKKWAFVSDYARFWILYQEGGLYFDTDVELIKPIDEVVQRGAFMGCETVDNSNLSHGLGVNPGLGLGADSSLELYKEILDYYSQIHFNRADGKIPTVVDYTSAILREHGWEGNGMIEIVASVLIYPPEYFCPYSYSSGKWNITEQTVSIHHYAASWHTWLEKVIINIERCDREKNPFMYRMRRAFSFAFRVVNKIKKLGIRDTLKFIREKKF